MTTFPTYQYDASPTIIVSQNEKGCTSLIKKQNKFKKTMLFYLISRDLCRSYFLVSVLLNTCQVTVILIGSKFDYWGIPWVRD